MPEVQTSRISVSFFEHLSTSGFAVQPDVLSSDEVGELVLRLDEVAAREGAAGTAWYSHNNQRVFNLVNKDALFLRLIEHPAAMEIVNLCLGPHCLLSSITANIARPGNRAQQIHADQDYVSQPWFRSEVVNLAYVLDEFTEENGATRVIPGSHAIGISPPKHPLPTEPIVARPGSLICLDGRVWHGTGQYLGSSGVRRAIFAYYCRPYIRQQENFSRSLRSDLRDSLTSVQRRLLGFDIWLGLGSVNGLPTSWMDGRTRIGSADSSAPGG